MGKEYPNKAVDDILLLKLIGEGDKQAFKYLFDAFFASLCRFIRTYINDPSIAEEIALDVFTAVWEKREILEINVSWKAYLFQSARNKALNHIRDNERFIPVSSLSFYDKAETDHSFELKELERLIQEAVCSLSGRNGEIFCKSRFEHLTNKEIAENLNISVKSVEAHITKALKIIRNHLGESYFYLW
jgi:RNA polymerase sigma-70 factor (ECF subfamily)